MTGGQALVRRSKWTGATRCGGVLPGSDLPVRGDRGRDGRIQRGQLVLVEAFGGGFTWGSALLRY